jgi:hypothetical protein
MVIFLQLNARVMKVRGEKNCVKYMKTDISPVVQIHCILLGVVPVKTVRIADISEECSSSFFCATSILKE